MTWTTEYPTKPGFYWIRNYSIPRYAASPYPDPNIVELDSDLDFYFFGTDIVYRKRDLLYAEWQGPIKPDYSISKPQYDLFPETTCAECLCTSNRFISWPLGEVDGKPRFGLICRECWIKRLTPEQRKVYMV
jgi:hypothetical protein